MVQIMPRKQSFLGTIEKWQLFNQLAIDLKKKKKRKIIL